MFDSGDSVRVSYFGGIGSSVLVDRQNSTLGLFDSAEESFELLFSAHQKEPTLK